MRIPDEDELTEEQLRIKYETKMTITNEELYALYQVLASLQNRDHSRTFAVALARNLREIEPLAQDLEREKMKIFQSYDIKTDGEGDPIVDANGQYIFEDEKEQQRAQQEFLAWLQSSEVEVNLQQVSESDLPERISGSKLIQLNPIIGDLDLSPNNQVSKTEVSKEMDTNIQEEVVYSDE